MHDADNWEKIPILEARAIGYRRGPKIGDFFPMAVKRHLSPREMDLCLLLKSASYSRRRLARDKENVTEYSY